MGFIIRFTAPLTEVLFIDRLKHMGRFTKKRSKKVGLSPGTLVYTGDTKEKKVTFDIFNYEESKLDEKKIENLDECLNFKDKPGNLWINIDGVLNSGDLEKLGRCFNIHSLALEDILSTDQRPKIEEYTNNLFIVLKMLTFNTVSKEIISEQVSLVFGSNYLISFQEGIEGDVFNNVRGRLRSGKGKHRRLGVDYLAYSLIDTVVDNYFVILENLGNEIEILEEEILKASKKNSAASIHKLKREMIFLHKSIWPLREVINNLIREDSSLVQDSTKIYLKDVYDHTIQVMDTIETYRDILSGTLDIYLSSMNTRLNEIMRILTIVSTVFTPPIFIAGIYGMNFEYLPEIKWEYGYHFALILMLISSLSMLYYFKKNRWI